MRREAEIRQKGHVQMADSATAESAAVEQNEGEG